MREFFYEVGVDIVFLEHFLHLIVKAADACLQCVFVSAQNGDHEFKRIAGVQVFGNELVEVYLRPAVARETAVIHYLIDDIGKGVGAVALGDFCLLAA